MRSIYLSPTRPSAWFGAKTSPSISRTKLGSSRAHTGCLSPADCSHRRNIQSGRVATSFSRCPGPMTPRPRGNSYEPRASSIGSAKLIHIRANRTISARSSGSFVHSASDKHSHAFARYVLSAAIGTFSSRSPRGALNGSARAYARRLAGFQARLRRFYDVQLSVFEQRCRQAAEFSVVLDDQSAHCYAPPLSVRCDRHVIGA